MLSENGWRILIRAFEWYRLFEKVESSDMSLVPSPTLAELFKNNTVEAIRICEKIICGEEYKTIDDFIKSNTIQSNKTSCQKCWLEPILTVRCDECKNDKRSCICLDCYLNGNHQGHHVVFTIGSNGNCDCGDTCFWKPSGFCSSHRTPDGNPDQTQVCASIRANLIQTFASATKSFQTLGLHNPEAFATLISWINRFTSMGDGYRRCLIIGMTGQPEFGLAINSAPQYSAITNSTLFSFLGTLTNDSVFNLAFSKTMIANLANLVEASINNLNSKPLLIEPLFQFSFHGFLSFSIKPALENGNPDWVNSVISLFVRIMRIHKNAVKFDESKLPELFQRMNDLIIFAKEVPSQAQSIILLRKKLIEALRTSDFAFSFKLSEQIPEGYALLSHTFFIWAITFLDHTKDCCDDISSFSATFSKFLIKANEISFTDKISSLLPRQRSVYSDAAFSPGLLLHIITSELFVKNGSSIGFMREFSSKCGLSLDDFCREVSILPIRLFAAFNAFLSDPQAFKCSDFYLIFINFAFASNTILRVAPLFSLIQLCLGAVSEKDSIIDMISSAFCTKEVAANPSLLKLIRLSFFVFIASLLTDRICLERSKKALNENIISMRLAAGACDISQIDKINIFLSEGELKEFLGITATKLTSESGNNYKLKVPANPFKPWNDPPKIRNILSNGNVRVPPLIEIEGFEFGSVLKCTSLLAVIYMTLSDAKADKDMTSIETVNIITDFLSVNSKGIRIHTSTLIVNSFSEIMNSLPLEFNKAINQNYSFKGRDDASIISLIEFLGGSDSMRKMGFEITENTNKEWKAKAETAKRAIQDEFVRRQAEYKCSSIVEDEANSCIVCALSDKPDDACFPMLTSTSMFPNLVERNIGGCEISSYDTLFCLNICSHYCHSKCIQSDEEGHFYCPADRLRRNCLLPRLSLDHISDSQKELIENFYNSFESEETLGDKVVDSYIGFILTNEVRLRSYPDCLDSSQSQILAKQFFFLLLHSERNGLLKVDKAKGGPLKRLILKLAASKNPEAEFLKAAKDGLKDLHGSQLWEFARRCEIFAILVLDHADQRKFIDWDEKLSYDTLRAKYEIAEEEVELRPFSLISLPKKMIDLSRQPYSIPMEVYKISKFLCLVTGICFEDKIVEGSREGLIAHLTDKLNNGPTILLSVCGPTTGTVYLADMQMNVIKKIPSIYLDAYGDEDIGYARGQMLYLNDERLDRYVDSIISGDWVNKVS